MQAASPLIDRVDSTRPWYAHIWPWLLMAGPVAVFLAGAYTSWLAFSKQDAMVVGDYYRQGKAINQDLRRDRSAAGLGLSFHVRYEPAIGKLNGTLQGFGAPLSGKISILLTHATQPAKDIRLAVQTDHRGEFGVDLPMLERTRWQVSIESERRDWRLTGVWKWPQQQAIAIVADLPSAD